MMFKFMLITIFGFSSIVTADLSGVVSGNRMAAVPLGWSLGEGELDIEGVCSEPGMTCQNCSLAVTCISLPVGWLKVPLQHCLDGETCNAHLKTCSKEAVPECDAVTSKYRHTCEQIGIFPDAFDCRKFHLCSPPEDLPYGRPADHRVALCPRHYGYDPKTAQCSVPLRDGQCSKRPVPTCTKVGQAAALEDSPNHYYVCLSKHGQLYPQIFICPHGWYFWDNFCRPEPERKINAKTSTTEKTASIETTTKLESPKFDFFSTEKPHTYPPDTFLADKFDLTNYVSIDDVEPHDDGSFSFENGDFW
ncbi:unnamed protein product [Danaus chrysippus]|uniref:(African queen) hypothetical protein n=1 Tax=Danaus chrysippus TaxID=151541 RepID=A0A8J2R6D1_9NEOP|nr:unnamed protein product [Danaus chrysippus]